MPLPILVWRETSLPARGSIIARSPPPEIRRSSQRRPGQHHLVALLVRGRCVVERAMASLPDEQRTAIVLKEYHGLTFQEIADLLGCPLSTVKTRLYQGLSVLRRRLERQQLEDASLRRASWESTS